MPPFDLPTAVTELATRDEAIVVVNIEGNIVLMTPHAEKLFGVAADDIVGESVEYLLPENLRFGHQAYRRGFLAEPNPREMDPGLHPHLQRIDDERQIPIAVVLEPIKTDAGLYVAAHVTPRES